MLIAPILAVITPYLPSHDITRLFMTGNRNLIYQLEHGGIIELTHWVPREWRHPNCHGHIFPRFLLSRLNSAINTSLSDEYLLRFNVYSCRSDSEAPSTMKIASQDASSSQCHSSQLYRKHSTVSFENDQTLIQQYAPGPQNSHSGSVALERYMAELWRLVPRCRLTHLDIKLDLSCVNAFLIMPLLYGHIKTQISLETSTTSFSASSAASSNNDLILFANGVPLVSNPVLPFPNLLFARLSTGEMEALVIDTHIEKLVVSSSMRLLLINRLSLGAAIMAEDGFDDNKHFLKRHFQLPLNAPPAPATIPNSPFSIIKCKILLIEPDTLHFTQPVPRTSTGTLALL